MSDVQQTFLPATAPPLVQAMDAVEQRLFRLPLKAISKDPSKVPVQLLDHLAWELSVDVWDPAWQEEMKRSVIAMAQEVHRFKGTPYAIKASLQALGFEPRLTEWFEIGASLMPQGSFHVDVYTPLSVTSLSLTSDELTDLAIEVTQRAAPVSRAMSVRLGYVQRQHAAVAQVGTAAIRLSGRAKLRRPYEAVQTRQFVSSAASLGIRLTGAATSKRFEN